MAPRPTATATQKRTFYAINEQKTAWIPGSRLAYSQAGRNRWELVLLDFNQDPPERQVLAQAKGEIANLAWSPDGQWIAYTDHDQKMYKDFVWVVDPDNPGSARMLNLEGFAVFSNLHWSPASDALVFSGMKGGADFSTSPPPPIIQHLWRIDLSTGRITRLTADEMQGADHPAWSPDGKWIAFDQDGQIWILDGQGKEVHRLIQTKGWMHSNPAWTRDSSQVLFYRMAPFGGIVAGTTGGPPGLWAIDLKGEEHPVTALGESFLSWSESPVVSPDGAWIALVYADEVYVVSTASGKLTKVSPEPASVWINSWAPNGQTLLYTTQSDGDFRLFLANMSPTDQDITTTGGKTSKPLSSKDGEQAKPLFPEGGNRDAVWEPPVRSDGAFETPVVIKLPVIPTARPVPTSAPTATSPPRLGPILAVQKPGLDELRAYFENLTPPAGMEDFFSPAKIFPEAEYQAADISGDGQMDLVKYGNPELYEPNEMISAIIYQDVSGDGWEDLIVYDATLMPYDNGWLFILPWDGSKYATPFIQRGLGSIRPSAHSSISFTDLTGEGFAEVIYKSSEAYGGTGLNIETTDQVIVHCEGTGCREVWSGMVSRQTDDGGSGGVEIEVVELKMVTNPRPSLQAIRRGFSVLCCTDLWGFLTSEASQWVIFPTTMTEYIWNGETFEPGPEHEWRAGQVITTQSRLEATGQGNLRRATVSWSPGDPYLKDEYCQLHINEKPVGSIFGCRHQFTQVEWRDITGDSVQEVVMTAISSADPIGPDGSSIGNLSCVHQRLIVYGWDKDKEAARLLADVNGCVIQADLFGVRIKDANGDGVMEIFAAADSYSGNVNEYRWNGERYVLAGAAR